MSATERTILETLIESSYFRKADVFENVWQDIKIIRHIWLKQLAAELQILKLLLPSFAFLFEKKAGKEEDMINVQVNNKYRKTHSLKL